MRRMQAKKRHAMRSLLNGYTYIYENPQTFQKKNQIKHNKIIIIVF